MNAFVISSVWDDPKIKRLDAEQKLAFFWLITNQGRNNIGYTKTTPERFSFETGLPFERLVGAIQSLPKSIASTSDSESLEVVLLNFIRKQYRRGQLTIVNPVLINVCNLICELNPVLRKVLLEHLQEFPVVTSSVWQGLNTGQPLAGAREGKGRVRTSSSYSEEVEDQEVLKFAREWPGEQASGAPPMALAWVVAWLARIRSRGGADTFPVKWQAALVCEWRRDFATWGANANGHAVKNGGQTTSVGPPRNPGMWEMTKRREALEQRIAEHPANETSANHVSDQVTPEEEQELADLQKELRELQRKISE